MKIQLLNYSNILSKKSALNNESLSKLPYFTGITDEKPDTFTITEENCNAEPAVQMKRIPLYKARNISGIHCPSCGIKMLSPEKYLQIINESEKLNSTAKLVDFLKNNQEFLSQRFKTVLNDTKRIPKYNKLKPKEYLLELGKLAHENKVKNIRKIKQNFNEFSNELEPDKREIFDRFVDSIDDEELFLSFREKLEKVAEEINLDTTQLNRLKKVSLKTTLNNELYYNSIIIPDLENLTDNQAIKIFITNIFRQSKNFVHRIEKYEQHDLNPNNTILICGECSYARSKNTFFKSSNQPDLKDNVIAYLEDISLLNGAKVIDIPHDYTTYVCHRMNQLTKGLINFDRNEIKIINKAQNILSRHDDFTPIKQTQVDIPCAECGSTLLPYTIKKKISEELSKCREPYEFAQIITKYDKYLGIYGHDFANIFVGIVDGKPNITKDELIRQYDKMVNNYLEMHTQQAVEKCRKNRSKYKRLSPAGKKLYEKVLNNVSKYIYSDEFKKEYNYQKLKQCFKVPDSEKVNIGALSTLKNELKKIIYMKNVALPNQEKFINNRERLYTIAYGFFCSNAATADHLIAASTGGESSTDNIIALCKGCNTLKGNKSAIAWYDQHPMVRINFPKQLHVIKEMAEDGIIEDYDDWAHNMGEQMYALTLGEFDIRKDFPPKT